MKERPNKLDNVVAPSVAEWDDIKSDKEKTGAKNATGTSGALEISIEETNKLRAQLGLKPLEIDGNEHDNDNNNNNNKKKKDEFVHKPAENISTVESQDKIKEKISTMREKRKRNAEFKAIGTIADRVDDEHLTDTAKWVENMRRIQARDLRKNNNDQIQNIKSEKVNLEGLAIAHDMKEFDQVGDETILVLKDSNVLEEDEDVLENLELNMLKQAQEYRKSKLSNYNSYENVDEFTAGEIRENSILSKYDEDIDGKKVTYSRIGKGGNVSMGDRMSHIYDELNNKYGSSAVSLNQENSFQEVSDFYTTRDNIRIKQRKKGRQKSKKISNLFPHVKTANDEELLEFHKRNIIRTSANNETNTSVDEAYDDLEQNLAINRQRNVSGNNLPTSKFIEKIYEESITKLAEVKGENELIEETKINNNDQIIVDDIREFIRSHNMKNETKTENILKQTEYDSDSDDIPDVDMNIKEEQDGKLHEFNVPPEDYQTVCAITNEPVLGLGIAAALQVARNKGYIEEDKKVTNHYKSNLPETSYQVDEERTKYESRGSFGQVFPEKKDYNPDVKLDNIDENGIIITQKEAFRRLSHKFHGNRPGKLKQHKRKKKMQRSLVDATSGIGKDNTEHALKTMEIMSEKQKNLQKPYLVLSGSGKANLVNK